MTRNFDAYLKQSPDPVTANLRLEHFMQNAKIRQCIELMSEDTLSGFVHLITISNFLYRFFCRDPELILGLENEYIPNELEIENITDTTQLRRYKYQRLLGITMKDIKGRTPYEEILTSLSILAEEIINKALEIIIKEQESTFQTSEILPLSIIAMGKLGAGELNYSSDVDLIFVCANEEDIKDDVHQYHKNLISIIRKLSKLLEEITEDGFLYRVDLKLRPLGRSGPLILSIDDTEHYYEGSSQAWERFAWLRARFLSGDRSLAMELLERLHSFIFHKGLSSEDLQEFLQIKNGMAAVRKKSDCWNVKLGKGGIRDIEFFIQVLQIVNAYQHPNLQKTNTLIVLNSLIEVGYLDPEEGERIRKSYLFLRKLENRLQIIDERQTHELPNDEYERIKIARSLGYTNDDDEDNLKRFNDELNYHREFGESCFDRILPEELQY